MGINSEPTELELELEEKLLEERPLPTGLKLKEGEAGEYVEWGQWDESGADTKERGLFKRIMKPRIRNHPYFEEFVESVDTYKGKNPEKLKFFEAGSGHGNDLRAVIDLFKEKGVDVEILGIEYSKKELKDGLKHYREHDPKEAQREVVKSLAQGDLRDLKNVKFYDPDSGEFTRLEKIEDDTFGVIYFEAILHAFGMEGGNYKEKRENAMKMLKELYRIAQPGAMFFGRANVFGPDRDGKTLSFKEQIDLLERNKEWRFFPKNEEEFKEMLREAGFEVKKTEVQLRTEEEIAKRPERKNNNRIAFLCQKPEKKG